MTSNHTKGNWSKGKGGWCIITDDKSEIDLEKRDTPDSVSYYGGALICESVKDKDINIISAAPELLEFALSIENDNNTIPKAIWDLRNKAINKALGNE